jgi:hypothetical protein
MTSFRALIAALPLLFLLPASGGMQAVDPLPGMPPLLDPHDVYAGARPGKVSPVISGFPDRIYVPNSKQDTVDVIDPHTFKIIGHFDVGKEPQHVVPSYDLKTLWVLSDLGDSLTRVDPATGHKVETIPIQDPYNMYYTPDGRFAIVVAERMKHLDFRDAQTMKLVESVTVPCRGVDHMDFASTGRYLIASCEFSGELVKVDVATRKVLGTLKLQAGAMPQDVRLAPDGSVFFVADMHGDGVHVIDGDAFKTIGHIQTGKGAHGLYFSRDSKDSRRRQPGHGRCVDRREGIVALRALSCRGVCVRHVGRTSPCSYSRQQRASRTVRVPTAGPIFSRPHWQHAVD